MAGDPALASALLLVVTLLLVLGIGSPIAIFRINRARVLATDRLWVSYLAQARADCRRSWQLDSSHVDHGWMMQWIDMCMIQPEVGTAECLEHIAQADPQDYSAYLCRGVAQWLRGNRATALTEIEQAITIEQEQWGAYFWRGVIYATVRRDEEAVASLQYALALNMPPILLAPLQWIKRERPDFYAQHVLPLLKRH